MTYLLTRLDELRKWLLKERQALSVMSDPILVRQGMEAVDLHLSTVDDACEGLQNRDTIINLRQMLSRADEILALPGVVVLPPAVKLSHPIPQSDYKAAQEEIDRRTEVSEVQRLRTSMWSAFTLLSSYTHDKSGPGPVHVTKMLLAALGGPPSDLTPSTGETE